MGFFTNLFQKSKDEAIAAYGRFTHKQFLEAAIGASYMVGVADGSFDQTEKDKMKQFLAAHPAFKGFTSDDIMAAFLKIDAFYALDRFWGDKEALKVLKSVQDQDEKEAIVFLTCMIGAADGNFDDNEKAVVKTICNAMNVSTNIHPAINAKAA